MSKKRYIGMYHDETQLMNRVEELNNEGWSDEDIYVVVKDDDHLSMLRSRTSAEVKSADGSWWDRFMGFISGEDHVHRMVDSLDFGKEDTERYYREIENGGMLLYVDSGEANRHYMENTDFYGLERNSTDVNLGANGLSVTDQELNGGDPAYRLNKTLPDQSLRADDEYGKVGGEAVLDRPRDYSADTLHDNRTEEERMRLHEERLQVDKQRVRKGEVRLEKDVVEEPRSVDVNVMHEEVTVERRPVTDGGQFDKTNSPLDNTAAFREDDETIRIPITEEHVEVTKKPVVTEEIVLKKHQVEEPETVHETVRREEVHLEKDGDIEVDGDHLDTDPLNNDPLNKNRLDRDRL
ncbi:MULTISPECIES: YsnF/AvaK domain-containing protein [Sporosarcina]|uniref:YsnF/AvaK domain-containing protein n=1 Tax=Sporosarcina TaxID=1569 RepID=UPI00129AEFB6|nr:MULTISPECIES: YsnF/AvaK domain-containing protein [Sporosarcina]GKV64995.1 stress response protein YsnF [Sporosarcina sp. NCCP-2331]GLB56630.1 stress response protein YsnF [Sporosarcina sp. NCCP-2378]